ncbi:hypothetical protein U9R90_06430 [Streptomyces sp. E11-3]|uniref:hypothetical protein n=1 Tax=Streptomyces sp. E11-3 TaxID=3110112 RepID=UPI00397E9B17
MSHLTDHTRRGFLGLTGRAAVTAAVGAVAFPVICSGQAAAAGQAHVGDRPGELPIVTRPDHPDARLPDVSAADYADGVSREPLNASAECGLPMTSGGAR